MSLVSAFPATAPTAEVEWLTWAGGIPRLQSHLGCPAPQRVLVVSPHPDDETLACGGFIADCRRLGHDVTVLAVTDGEGSHPDVDALASVRRDEQARALALLGCRAPVRLGLPDRAVRTRRAELQRSLRAIAMRSDVVVAPWSRDGHGDHDACGAAAEAVCDALDIPLLEYPVWAWQWATPAAFDEAASWSMIELSPRARHDKRAALRCFPSQTTDRYGSVIVDGAALARFARPFEVVARVR
jgi:LmbE family N-acetylglucosaminyl deacetylase